MRRVLLALSCFLLPSIAAADDWPQFRGPERSGVSKEKGLLKAWPKGGPKLAWTYHNAGLGFSSVAVAKGVVYTLGTDAKFQDEIIIALDEKSGAELWTAKIGPIYTYKGNSYGDGPRSTPTIDGNLLFALSGLGELVCVDVANKGKEVWRKDLIKDLGSDIMREYGYSESPLVDGERLICTPGGPQGTLAALDKKTGKIVWRSKDWTDKAPFSSVVAADIQGVRQYVQNGYISDIKGAVVAGINAKTGARLWIKPILTGGGSDGVSTTPIVKDNQVYITNGFGAGCRLIEINAMQNAEEKYTKAIQKKFKSRNGGVVLIGDYIYGHSEPASWICQEMKTGDVKWMERNAFNTRNGAVIAAEGMLYLYTEDAEVGLVPANPQGFDLISSFALPMKSKIVVGRGTSRQAKSWAHPAIANGHLYVRDHEYIFAFDIRK